MKLSTIIKQYREDNNISGRTFAKACGISHSYISQLENGIIKSPTLSMVSKIANCMGYDLDDFMSLLDDDIVVTVKAKPIEETITFTDNEKNLINKYRKLDKTEKKFVDDLVDQFIKEKWAIIFGTSSFS